MKKIIIIEELSVFHLFFFFVKFFFDKVYYRDLKENLKKNWIDNFLKKFGILNLGFEGIESLYFLRSFAIRKKLELNLLKNSLTNNNLYLDFVKKYKIDHKKFKLCLRGELIEIGDHSIESQSVSLIEKYKFLENKKIYYFTNRISSYLLLKNYHKNLKVTSVFFLLNLFFVLVKKKLNMNININFNKKLKKKLINLKNFKIAYFPHKGFKYAKSYNKTFYFNKSNSSKFNQKYILNILLEAPSAYTKRFLSFWRMPNILITNYKQKIKFFSNIFLFTKYINSKNLFSIHKLVSLYLIFYTIFKIEQNLKFLEKLPKLKIILCDYDILFPKTMLLACGIKKIKTASIQERYAVNTLLPPLFFNYYFIAGKAFETFFIDYGYLVDKYYPIGTSRSSLFKNKKKLLIQSNYSRLINIKKKIILFVGIGISDRFQNRLNGEDGASIKNNIFFFRELINLSKKFKEFYFVVRLKNYNNFGLLPKNIIYEINNSKNIEIDFKEKINIYDLLSICDLVISRQTSVVEECLSDNIPVLVLDEVNFFSNYDSYPLSKLVVCVKNSNELNMYFEKFKKGENFYNLKIKNEIKKYFFDKKNNKDFKSKLQNVLETII